MKRVFLILPLILLFSGNLPAEPILYQYTDENGIITYTNKFEKVPEAFRKSARPIERTELPALVTVLVNPLPAETPPVDPWYRHWLKTAWFKAVVGLGVLTAATFAAVRWGAGTILLRTAGKLLLIVFTGTAFYSMYQANQYTMARKAAAGPFFKRLSPIEEARRTAEAFEKKIEDQEEMIDSIDGVQ